MRLNRYFIMFLALLLSVVLFSFVIKNKRVKSILYSTFHPAPSLDVNARLRTHGIQLKSYLAKHTSYNREIAFMIDMKIPSNKYRFFVYNLKSDSILKQGMVAHGYGSNTIKTDSLVFKNEVNSKCTSLGKYKIGNKYDGRFGESYKLHGLDKTNDKAFERYVVLHSYSEVPYNETVLPIVNSEGCAMTSPDFLEQVEPIIDNSSKPILLYIYY